MKRALIFTILLIASLCFAGCETDDNTGSVTVNVTYNGKIAPTVKASVIGTGRVSVYLYSTLVNGDSTEGFVYSIDSDTAVASSKDIKTVTIDGIKPGNYKVAAFYDMYSAKASSDSTGLVGPSDFYVIYNNAGTPDDAAEITVAAGSSETLDMTITGDVYLSEGSIFAIPGK